MSEPQPIPPRTISPLEQEINYLDMTEKTLRKTIGGLTKGGEDYLRTVAEALTFFIIDETKIKSREEMISEVRTKLKTIRTQKIGKIHFLQEGSPGLEDLIIWSLDMLGEREQTARLSNIKTKIDEMV